MREEGGQKNLSFRREISCEEYEEYEKTKNETKKDEMMNDRRCHAIRHSIRHDSHELNLFLASRSLVLNFERYTLTT
jgi:hypothetical protein